MKKIKKKLTTTTTNHRSKGYVSTISGTNSNCAQADGSFTTARFNSIGDLYFDSTNNQLLISDNGNNRFKVLDFNCKLSISFLVAYSFVLKQNTIFFWKKI